MAAGLTPALVAATIVVALVSLGLIVRHLPLLPSLGLVLARMAVPMVYFAWFADGRWTFIDDVTYWQHGQLLLASGYDPLSALLRQDGLALMVLLSLGPHFLMAWWNLLAQYLFGPHYWAAVLMNVGLCFASASLLFSITRRLGFSVQYARGLLVFFIFHWELLVWSSFINLKDVLVATLTLAAFYFFVRISGTGRERPRLYHWVGLAGVLLTLPWLRFYIPVLFLGSCGIWVLLKKRGWRKYLILGAAAAGLLLALPRTLPSGLLVFDPPTVAVNTLRVLLTPQPWSVDPEYAFLLIPAVLHWMMIVPAFAGALLLWRTSPRASLFVMYLGVITLFYAVVPEIVSPRNRVQVLFIWSWVQYHALYELLRVLSARWAMSPIPVSRPAPPRQRLVGAA